MLSSNEAHRIIRGVQFPGEEKLTQNERIVEASKTSRRKLITHHPHTTEQRIAAAVEIQRLWRGFWTRLRLASILLVTSQQKQTGHLPGRKPPPSTPSTSSHKQQTVTLSNSDQISHHEADDLSKSSSRLPRLYLRYQSYLQKSADYGTTETVSYEEFCAHFIQNWWFKVRRKKTLSDSQSSELSSHSPVKSISVVMSLYTCTASTKPAGLQPKKKKREGPMDRGEAATMIQRTWRRHVDLQVYRYYRDLINFRCCGDPALMLRCINPRESQLLDPAAGIHIKFRLAGFKFPPNIYYKIFTHRNIVDMCANSPKDYTAVTVKRREAKDVHNRRKGKGDVTIQDREGWYQRIENNGWRLISDRLILKADQDPVTWESSKKPMEFHHSKLRRKVDVERKKRRRKLEWMQKMYRDGIVEAKTKESFNTNAIIEGAASGMLAVMDERGADAIEEWEVEELLEWTDGLNFDDYLSDWQAIATSASSMKHTGDSLKFDTTLPDPFEFSLSMKGSPVATSPSHPSTGKRAPMSTPLKTGVAVM